MTPRYPTPLAILALGLVLASCAPVADRTILHASVRLPSAPPAPVIPASSGEMLSIEGVFRSRLGDLPRGDSTKDLSSPALALQADRWSGGGLLAFHYKLFWMGIELSPDQGTLLLGANVEEDGWRLLMYGGFGACTVRQDLVVQQNYVANVQPPDTLRYGAQDVLTGNKTLGLSLAVGNGMLQPFAGGRISFGPRVDIPLSDAITTNAFTLGQVSTEAGIRVTAARRLHLLVGAGWRKFTSGAIRGSDWNAFGGLSIDLARSKEERNSRSAEEDRSHQEGARETGQVGDEGAR